MGLSLILEHDILLSAKVSTFVFHLKNINKLLWTTSKFDSWLCSLSSNSHSPSPPSSSLAYSLLSASSEQDPPSTSGCSSDQSARVQTQKELMRALNELKIRLPPERKMKGRSSTLNALKYALSCVRQVRGEREFHMLVLYAMFYRKDLKCVKGDVCNSFSVLKYFLQLNCVD